MNASSQRNNEKIVGPFGTEISNTNSSSGTTHTPESGGGGVSDINIISPAPPTQNPSMVMREGRYYNYGHNNPSSIPFPWRLSEEDEEAEGEGENDYLGPRRGLGSTANSSVEDLLRGQEPSFFSVILNPRRTLRVVNLD